MRLPAPSGLRRKTQNRKLSNPPVRQRRTVVPGVLLKRKPSKRTQNPLPAKISAEKPFPHFSCGKGFSAPGVPFYVLFGERFFLPFLYALRSMESLSAIMAMNSPLVGLSSGVHTLYPKAVFRVSTRPRFHATSMAWRMARSTLLADVPK